MTSGSNRPPNWALWFQDFSKYVSELGLQAVGGRQTHAVVSVPTGQFAVWMIACGGFQAEISNSQLPEVGVRYSGWYPTEKRMDDFEFIQGKQSQYLSFASDPNTRVIADIKRPLKALPEGTPFDRAGQGVGKETRGALRRMEGMKNNWTVSYADQCLSPVVIIGTGRTYLHNQRIELLEKVPEWMDDLSQVLLSEDSHQTSNPARMYFHPFMVFSPGVGDQRQWLRQMTPKLVVYTSWSAYEQRHDSLFSQSPHIVLANRRVEKSLLAADYVQDLNPDPRISNFLQTNQAPSSIYVRSFTKTVLPDTGDSEESEDLDLLVDI